MIDAEIRWVRASTAMRAGHFADAVVLLRQLLETVDRIEYEYDEWLKALMSCYRQLGRWREAMACSAYLGRGEQPRGEQLQREVSQYRAGDVKARRGIALYGIYLSRAKQHAAAAKWFAVADMPVHQAIELEKASQDEAAITLWMHLLAGEMLREYPYERALARINYGLCLLRLQREQARQALAEATTAVEEVADGFESDGLRERAFDCYQLLARLGADAGAFENIAEGYLNSIRILKDDGLKLDALRLYETFVALARKFGEYHAVATILREASDYCTRAGLPYTDDLRLRCGEAWLRAAAEAQTAGHPLQIVENAYLAAADVFASIRAYTQVANVYRRMLSLELPPKSRERCQRLLQHLNQPQGDAPRPIPVPEFLKQIPDYEEVWYVDLAEWELAGDPTMTAAGVMADRRFPDYVRRHALLLVLDLEQPGARVPPGALIERLSKIRAYPVIAALEHQHQLGHDPQWEGASLVREAVAKAMGELRFKRSFSLLIRALRDPSQGVRLAAASSVAKLIFPHAFEPLRRIYESRDLPDPTEARVAALRAIGKIGTVEALDFLCDRLREGEQPYVELARAAISELNSPELLPYIRRQVEYVPSEFRATLEDAVLILSQRGR